MLTKSQTVQRKSFSEENDCTVRAFAIATQVPYAMAHKLATDSGRVHGTAWLTSEIIRIARGYGLLFVQQTFKGNISQFMKSNPVGRFIIETTDHALCVIDGQRSDLCNVRCNVETVWKFIEDESEE